ncbi:MAG: hypothetical protein KGL48_01880 [Sphingomonadales bacterium]|nr:hypothetical protein [Sphingomonadales bacterium]MDE2569886.1 hypothetical protein [Sphingomonadales bacterium]
MDKLTATAPREPCDSSVTASRISAPWALAGDTLPRHCKRWPNSGGTHTPMIVRWPAHVDDPGEGRRAFVDCIDPAPTIAAAAGARFEPVIDGVAQIPVAGRSILPMLTDPRALGRGVQYFGLRGNRGMTDDAWRAVAMRDCDQPSFASDRWQLFDLAEDFSEAIDLDSKKSQWLEAMQALWHAEWTKYGTGPLKQPSPFICEFTRGQPQRRQAVLPPAVVLCPARAVLPPADPGGDRAQRDGAERRHRANPARLA